MDDGSQHLDQIMETPTSFNLSRALEQWRREITETPAIPAGDLEELEAHLRDSVASLESKGLSSEEAFWVARSRLGDAKVLNEEYAKTNAESVWIHRALWMLMGWVGIGAVSALVTVLATWASVGAYKIALRGNTFGLMSLLAYLSLIAMAGWILWKLRRGRGEKISKLGGWMKTHPWSSTLFVFFLLILQNLGSAISEPLVRFVIPVSDLMPLYQWQGTAKWVLPILFWPLTAAWLLKSSKKSLTTVL
jgi:hypothetical protein